MLFYAVIAKENAWYVATALPSGVTSQGTSVEEAKANLKEALELYYDDQDVEAPDTSEPLLTPLEVKTRHG